jgi:hypothetical protein
MIQTETFKDELAEQLRVEKIRVETSKKAVEKARRTIAAMYQLDPKISQMKTGSITNLTAYVESTYPRFNNTYIEGKLSELDSTLFAKWKDADLWIYNQFA